MIHDGGATADVAASACRVRVHVGRSSQDFDWNSLLGLFISYIDLKLLQATARLSLSPRLIFMFTTNRDEVVSKSVVVHYFDDDIVSEQGMKSLSLSFLLRTNSDFIDLAARYLLSIQRTIFLEIGLRFVRYLSPFQ